MLTNSGILEWKARCVSLHRKRVKNRQQGTKPSAYCEHYLRTSHLLHSQGLKIRCLSLFVGPVTRKEHRTKMNLKQQCWAEELRKIRHTSVYTGTPSFPLEKTVSEQHLRDQCSELQCLSKFFNVSHYKVW